MQFSTRFLLLLVAVAAFYCSVFALSSPVLGVLALVIVTILLPPLMVSGIIWGQGMTRAYWIGFASSFVLLPVSFTTFSFLGLMMTTPTRARPDVSWVYMFVLATFHLLCIIGGFIAVVSKWFYSRPDKVTKLDATKTT